MIRTSFVVAMAMSIFLVVGCAGRAEEPPKEALVGGQPESLHKAIGEGIALLEANKMDEYFERFFAPGRIAYIKDAGSGEWERTKKELAQEVRSEDLRALKEIQSRKAELSSDGKDAVFDLPFSTKGLGSKIGFEKLGDRWVIYLRERELKNGETRVEQPKELQQTIDRMIDAVEGNRREDLIKTFPPDQQKMMKEDFEQHGRPSKEQLAMAMKILKELKSTSRKVVLSAVGNTAAFEVSAEAINPTMTFKKIDGAWYFSER